MADFSYLEIMIIITILWVIARTIRALINGEINWKRELLLMLVYVCIAVITRIVYFPWHLEEGHIGHLYFDASRIRPFRLNIHPFVHLFDVYDGWKLNLYGNIAMFIPVGIVWPLCFKKLNNVFKVVLAGAGFSLLIELTQLLLYDRGTDVDDLITNTTGVLLGAVIYFVIKKIHDLFEVKHKKGIVDKEIDEKKNSKLIKGESNKEIKNETNKEISKNRKMKDKTVKSYS